MVPVQIGWFKAVGSLYLNKSARFHAQKAGAVDVPKRGTYSSGFTAAK
jgi:hypothetical protein